MSNKERKKNLKRIERQSTGENDEIIRMIKVLAVVVLALALFYFVFAIYNGEISFGKKEDDKKEVEIQNVEILAGSTFNRVDDEYYVIFYDFDGNNSTRAVTFYNLYSKKSEHLKMYVVDLGNAFNSKCVVSSRDEVNVTNASSLKVMDLSIIKVKDGKAEFIAAGVDEFDNYQKTLLK